MKKTIYSFLFLPLLIGQLCSSEENTISALNAIYEDSNLILNGEVKLFHGLGTLCAEKASLYKQENDKDRPFSQVHLENQVQIFCKNESTLHCDVANLNFETLKGDILSKGDQPVLYTGKIVQNGNKVPFSLQGQTFNLLFEKKGEEYTCNELTAKKDVVISYTNDFILKAHEANYKKTSDTSLNEIVKAYPLSSDSYCQLCYLKETIKSSYIEIHIHESHLHLKNPSGSLPSSIFFEKEQGKLFLSCKDLNWDHLKGILTLKEEIQIQESHFGSLSADRLLVIKQNKEKDNMSLKSIHVEGKSILSHGDYKLTSYGSLDIDGLKGQITISSPKIEGKSKFEEQILFQNNDMQLQADSAFLEYTEPSHDLSALTFTGNVHIKSLDNNTLARCALADKLIYAPDTKTIILSAHLGKKVLFWDEEQEVTISAKEVHLTQNSQTNKTEIKGIGNMKLTLSQEEENLLKNSFPTFRNLEDNNGK